MCNNNMAWGAIDVNIMWDMEMNRLHELRAMLNLTTPGKLDFRRRYDCASNDVHTVFRFVRRELSPEYHPESRS